MKNEWLRKEIQNFEPYRVAPITVPIVINANESFQSLWDLPEVKADLAQELAAVATNRYPLPYADELRELVGAYCGKKAENILLGNGGDEMISLITQAFLERGDKIIVHSPTFDMYAIGAESMGARAIAVPDRDDMTHDTEQLLQAIAENDPKIVYLCNPNNPTGALWSREELDKIIKAAPRIVLLDEAYMEFAEDQEASLLPELDNYLNLYILRTLSKAFGLAGARLGYLAASPEAIDLVSRVKAPYNLNVFSQAVGRVALRHKEKVLALVPAVQQQRRALLAELSSIGRVRVFPSATNFILLQSPLSGEIYEALLGKGILVKKYGAGSRLADCLRITVTTAEVNKLVADTIREVAC